MDLIKYTRRVKFISQKRSKALVLSLIIGAILAIFYLVFNTSLLKVQEIDVSYEKNERVEKYVLEIRLEEEVLGKSIIFLNTSKVENDLRAEFLPLESMEFKKRFPKSLKIKIVERKPLLKVLLGEDVYLVDKSGLLFSRGAKDVRLPSIILESSLTLGSFIDSKELNFILKTLTALNPEKVQEVSLQGEEVVKIRYEETEILLSVNKDISTQLDNLRTVQESYRIKGKRLKRIDLRFNRPVIEY